MSITKLIRIPSKVPASVIKEAVESYQKTLREDVNPYLKESKEDVILVTKGIYTQDGKKVDGARKSIIQLGAVDKHGIITDLTWKEWVALKVPDTSSAGTKKEFLNRLAKPIKQMAKKIELNTFLKGLPSFEDAVNYIMKLDSSVKYSKSGLKESSNMSNKNYGWATDIHTSHGHRFSVGEEMYILVDRGNEYIAIYDSKAAKGLTHDDSTDTAFIFKTTVEYIGLIGSSVDKDEDHNFADDEGVEFYFETELKNTVGKNVKDDTKTTKLTDEELYLIEKLLEEEFTFKKYS